MLKDIKSEEFQNEVLNSNIPVLVDFWASWCGPCKMMGPVLEEIAKKFDGRLNVIKINVDEPGNDVLSMKYGIMNIPNMKLFKNGEVVKDFVGFRGLEDFSNELNELV